MNMKDVAQMANVSIATVSRVINQPRVVKPETRKRVERVLEQTNFVANAVARGLVLNSTRTVGVLAVDIRDQYFAEVTYTIERNFTELGYNVILSNTGGELGEKKKCLRLMLEKKVDGLILVGSVFKERNSNLHILAASRYVPVVMVNCGLEGENVYSILCDDAQGIRDAVASLAQAGHTGIYYFNDVRTFSGLAKREGFERGMREFGLNPANVVEIQRTIDGGRVGIRRLISEGAKVTAVVTGEDLTAVGVLKGLQEEGLESPQDVAVIGYNNSILAQASSPTLTSVNNMAESMAAGAVNLLYDILQGKQASRKTVLTPALVHRDSAPPPASHTALRPKG